tara:strand:+ start:120 stop:377 length:258 start_codon:yes stop_codon:yes gene_type:complete
MIVSPCISICKTDPISGYCYGCARNSEEKIKWKDKNTDEEWKLENLREIRSRMKGWQLQSFEESYKFKCENGISIEKKRKILSNV